MGQWEFVCASIPLGFHRGSGTFESHKKAEIEEKVEYAPYPNQLGPLVYYTRRGCCTSYIYIAPRSVGSNRRPPPAAAAEQIGTVSVGNGNGPRVRPRTWKRNGPFSLPLFEKFSTLRARQEKNVSQLHAMQLHVRPMQCRREDHGGNPHPDWLVSTRFVSLVGLLAGRKCGQARTDRCEGKGCNQPVGILPY